MNQFTFIGKIGAIKESEKFHPIEQKKFDSGWVMQTVKFNCISGTNRVMCLAQGGKWANDKKNVIKTFSKTVKNADGTTKKGEKIEIAWDKRFDEEEIDKVAGYKKFVVDLGNFSKKKELEKAINSFEKDNDASSFESTGYNTIEEVKAALEKENARRHVFLSEYDFAEYMAKVVNSDKIKGKKFRISGTQDIQYSKGNFYTNYHVNRVELTTDDAEECTDLNIDLFFAADCINDDDFQESGKAYLNGWTTYYDSSVKKNGFVPMVITVRDKVSNLKRKFIVGESEIANIGIVTTVVDGADFVQITVDDLDDDTKQDIEDGFITEEEAIRAAGGSKTADRVSEIRFKGLNARQNKVEDTDYSIDDMTHAMADVDDDSDDGDSSDDDDDDI